MVFRRATWAFAVVPLGGVYLACTPASDPPADGAGGGTLGSGGTGGPPGSGGAVTGGSSGDTGGAATGGTASSGGGTSSGGVIGTGGSIAPDIVTRTESTYSFQHYPIEVDAGGVWNGATTPGTTATTTTYNTVILENASLKVTLLPEYGGRILSIVHKPTGKELLYQNPVGTPYLMGEDIFYYNYLVILGGIFPSFPEPEHGKYWNQPYELTVISDNPSAITVRMSRQDDLDIAPGVPSKYDVGRTGVSVDLEVTLRAGRSNLELKTTLTNPGATAIPAFEYWTVTTLAPGSVPGDTKIPQATRILADMDQVHCLESSWAWFADAEQRIDGEVFEWKNLSHFENWDDQGTCFANPRYDANWSGLINYESDQGIVHVSDGPETPGLKLWTFGTQSLTVDLTDSTEWLRPTIEMWHGVTPEFWNRGSMAASEVRTWTDHFFSTLGLEEVTAASEYGAVRLSRTVNGTDAVVSALATLNIPGQTVHAVLEIDGATVHEEDVIVDPAQATTVEVTLPATSAPAGATLSAAFRQGASVLLSGEVVLE